MKTNSMQGKLCTIVKPIFRKIKRLNIKTILGITFLLLFIPKSNAQSFNSNMAAILQDTLDYFIASNPSTKGVSVAVYCPGMGIWEGVGGISHTGVPITSDMKFPLASNTKLFTSTAMMILEENNLLNLDDPISNYIPNFANVNPAITVRQLLNHTSGVEDMYYTVAQFDSVAADPNRIWTPEEVLAWIGPPANAPGIYHYSNTNYILLGMIAESITGNHISQLIRDSILTPLNLDSTFYGPQETVVGTVPHPWKSGVDVSGISRNSLFSAIGPAGCMYSTANEMAQWYIALMNGEVVNANSLDQMTNFLPPPSNYGFGITRYTFNGSVEYGHGGLMDGGRTRTLYDTCRQVFVVGLCNANPSGIDGLTVTLHSLLVNYLPGCPGNITGTTTVCQGDSSITYSIPLIPGATSYVWTLPTGATGVSVTNSITVDYSLAALSGDIIVSGINNYGQSAPSKLAVTVNATPPAPTISLLGNTLHSDAPAGNQWFLDGVLIPGATSQDYVVTTNGEYSVMVTLTGCSSPLSNLIPTNLGTENETDNQMILVYPNPSNGIFRIKLNDVIEGTLYIYNALGQQMYQSTNFNNEINLTNQSKGTYYMKLVSTKKVYSKKIILQ